MRHSFPPQNSPKETREGRGQAKTEWEKTERRAEKRREKERKGE